MHFQGLRPLVSRPARAPARRVRSPRLVLWAKATACRVAPSSAREQTHLPRRARPIRGPRHPPRCALGRSAQAATRLDHPAARPSLCQPITARNGRGDLRYKGAGSAAVTREHPMRRPPDWQVESGVQASLARRGLFSAPGTCGSGPDRRQKNRMSTCKARAGGSTARASRTGRRIVTIDKI